MGFCVFNNIGVAVNYARQKHNAKRVCVLDFDVHHGNGTQVNHHLNELLQHGTL
jgi:acetoin utilization deacetylase AcuC-like enzyme